MNPGRRTPFQAAYCVNDVERAIHKWNRLYGAGPFVFLPHHKSDTDIYRGRRLKTSEVPDLSHAVGYLGELMIQLVAQHDDKPSVYREMYAAGEEGFHHFAYLTGAFDEECRRLLELGFEPVSQFTDGGAQGAYFDTRPDTGCFTEIHTNESHILEAFTGWRRAHELFKPGDKLILNE